jgi:hypothetical protein
LDPTNPFGAVDVDDAELPETTDPVEVKARPPWCALEELEAAAPAYGMTTLLTTTTTETMFIPTITIIGIAIFICI